MSHSKIALTHQHWIMQILSAGAFGVTCTQSSEASHKQNMRLPSARVRHRRQPDTQRDMSKYMQYALLFEEIKTLRNALKVGSESCFPNDPKVGKPLKCPAVVGKTLTCPVTGSNLPMGPHLQSPTTQKLFLHPQVRLTRVELMDMFCSKLEVPHNQLSYTTFNSLVWTFGQTLKMKSSCFWATDDNYLVSKTTNTRSQRRDVFILEGTEVGKKPDGTPFRNALCCEAVCFVTIANLMSLRRFFTLRSIQGLIHLK